MKANLVAIKDCVVKAKTWNPVVEAKDETIKYIDIAAVDKDLKKIVEPTLCLGSEAPSRARQLVQTNDVLVSTVRPNLNSVAVVTEEFNGATASTGYTVLRPLPEILDSQYLFHWVKADHFINEMIKLAIGQSYPAVSDKIILNSKIPLPPIEEQRRIASILDQADELRRKRQQAIEKLDQLLQAMFIDMFGDPVSNPKGFPVHDLEFISSQVTDGTHHTPKRESSGIPLLSARNVLMGRIDFENTDFVGEAEYERLRKRCEPLQGDILISCSGSIGRVSTVDTDLPFVMVRSAALVKLKRELATPKFVEYLLRTPYLQSQMIRSSKSSSQANLFQEPIKRLKIFLPPLDLQEKFEEFISISTKEKEKLLQSNVILTTLFKSLQNHAFSGTL
ncbi:hypothetical protein BFR69_03695 [Acinetobacter pittii]|uniref:restriction endonuclease subunit S n=1 Tax=Acinetobacter calcoaceticus/baumannii complex TaxID=909768 RepID=UPI0002FECDF2|nr:MULTISPECIES: restriction endonuclease subunit S [Acinetobacter calcoaceticus/baumannii complex]AZB97115.1 restriction endonuclease subunit S [Acinetobacter pittii]KRI19580.1 hypothetical protein APC96_03440 [Acinetobacter pittii]MBM9552321.1 restriction endonuclease subunit S [Acinetobacter nosocomialis]MCJ9034394.1 restriction endonuclease subunit S [Acinetobacter nosocomialis]MDP8031921.1 restriction endonuclease subunit S [Acinetobacter pittii]